MPRLTSMDYRSDVRLLRADNVVDPEPRFSRVEASRATAVAAGS